MFLKKKLLDVMETWKESFNVKKNSSKTRQISI